MGIAEKGTGRALTIEAFISVAKKRAVFINDGIKGEGEQNANHKNFATTS